MARPFCGIQQQRLLAVAAILCFMLITFVKFVGLPSKIIYPEYQMGTQPWTPWEISFLASTTMKDNTTTTLFNKEHDIASDQVFIVTKPANTPQQRRHRGSTPIGPRNGTRTIFIGFADDTYKELGLQWYRRLERIGYTAHYLVAYDDKAATFFQQHHLRFDYLHNEPRFSFANDCSNKKKQIYRRRLFGSRWVYIWQQLQAGYHVLTSDVDTIYSRYIPFQILEDSKYDAFHTLNSVVPSYPVSIFQTYGFTLNGGQHWFRSTPGVRKWVHQMVQTCGSCIKSSMNCRCMCDDQVVFNNLAFESVWNITWNRTSVLIPQSWEQVPWEGITGVCSKTGHHVQVWDRHMAYRGKIRPEACPQDNWFAMLNGVPKTKLPNVWDRVCGWNSSNFHSFSV